MNKFLVIFRRYPTYFIRRSPWCFKIKTSGVWLISYKCVSKYKCHNSWEENSTFHSECPFKGSSKLSILLNWLPGVANSSPAPDPGHTRSGATQWVPSQSHTKQITWIFVQWAPREDYSVDFAAFWEPYIFFVADTLMGLTLPTDSNPAELKLLIRKFIN